MNGALLQRIGRLVWVVCLNILGKLWANQGKPTFKNHEKANVPEGLDF
jgi:hypothetical protein